ncbi:MAG: dipeptide epimerase [Rhizobiales bacterium]|nr:dipeptide epimerase [Hyphomicrobiales bacterium]
MPRLSVAEERFPIAGRFTISRGSRTEAVVVTAAIAEDNIAGRGECVPYARYGETVEGVRDLIAAQAGAIAQGATRRDLARLLPAGAARNALDCALWNLEAKRAGKPVWEIANLPRPLPVITAYTLSLGTPDEMEAAARRENSRPLLKIKLGGEGDDERIAAVRRSAPQATLIADANEAWSEATFQNNMKACERAGVKLIEQPFPADQDGLLLEIKSTIPICADESVHDAASLDGIAARYQMINIKLDKTGGLTEALKLAQAARAKGLGIMVGCMVGTSLAMAPAMLLAGFAQYIDLDGPLLLARDRDPGLRFEGSQIHPPTAELWG